MEMCLAMFHLASLCSLKPRVPILKGWEGIASRAGLEQLFEIHQHLLKLPLGRMCLHQWIQTQLGVWDCQYSETPTVMPTGCNKPSSTPKTVSPKEVYSTTNIVHAVG